MSRRHSRWDNPYPRNHPANQSEGPGDTRGQYNISRQNPSASAHSYSRIHTNRSPSYNQYWGDGGGSRNHFSKHSWTNNRKSNRDMSQQRPFRGTGILEAPDWIPNQQRWNQEDNHQYSSHYNETHNFEHDFTSDSSFHWDAPSSSSAGMHPNQTSNNMLSSNVDRLDMTPALHMQFSVPPPIISSTTSTQPLSFVNIITDAPLQSVDNLTDGTLPNDQTKLDKDHDKTPTTPTTKPTASREQMTRKLIGQLTRMNKHNLKHMINDPNSKYAKALQSHARFKNREEMRKQLRIISGNQDTLEGSLQPDECVDSSTLPSEMLQEISRVLSLDGFESATTEDEASQISAEIPPDQNQTNDDEPAAPRMRKRISHFDKRSNVIHQTIDDNPPLPSPVISEDEEKRNTTQKKNLQTTLKTAHGKSDVTSNISPPSAITVYTPSEVTTVASAQLITIENTATTLTEAEMSVSEPKKNSDKKQIKKKKIILNTGLDVKKFLETNNSRDDFIYVLEHVNRRKDLLRGKMPKLPQKMLLKLRDIEIEHNLKNVRNQRWYIKMQKAAAKLKQAERYNISFTPMANDQIVGGSSQIENINQDEHGLDINRRLPINAPSDVTAAHAIDGQQNDNYLDEMSTSQPQNADTFPVQQNTITLSRGLDVAKFLKKNRSKDDYIYVLDNVTDRDQLLSGQWTHVSNKHLSQLRKIEMQLNPEFRDQKWYNQSLKKRSNMAGLEVQTNASENTIIGKSNHIDEHSDVLNVDSLILDLNPCPPIESSFSSTTASSTSPTVSTARHTYFTYDSAEDAQPSDTEPVTTDNDQPHLLLSEPYTLSSITDTNNSIDKDNESSIPANPIDQPIPLPMSTSTETITSSTKPTENTTTSDFVETSDGRIGQRASSTSQLQRTLKGVPRQILSAISKRLQQLDDDTSSSKTGGQTTSNKTIGPAICVDEDIDSEEEVIDITPAVPSVDLTDDANDLPVTLPTPVEKRPSGMKRARSKDRDTDFVRPRGKTQHVTDQLDEISIQKPKRTRSTRVRRNMKNTDETVPVVLDVPSAIEIQTPQFVVESPPPKAADPPVILQTQSISEESGSLTSPIHTTTPTRGSKRHKKIVAVEPAELPSQAQPTPPSFVPETAPVVNNESSELDTLKHPQIHRSPVECGSATSPHINTPTRESRRNKKTVTVEPEKSPSQSKPPSAVSETAPIVINESTQLKSSQIQCSPVESAPSSTAPDWSVTVQRRLWRSPGEKKCIEPTTSVVGSIQKNIGDNPPSVNDKVIQRMRDIDTQMLSLQETKMKIDEIILQKQREKMAIEQNVMALQNERAKLFSQLLSKAAPANAVSEGVQPIPITTTSNSRIESDEDEGPRFTINRRISTKPSAVVKRTKRDSVSSQSSSRFRRITMVSSDESDDDQTISSLPSNLDCPEFQHILRNPGRICLKDNSNIVVKQSNSDCIDTFGSPSLIIDPSDEIAPPEQTDSTAHSFVHRSPIVHLQAVDQTLVAASVAGHIYTFDLISGQLLDTIKGHSRTITGFVFTSPICILSISLDGYMRINHLVNNADLPISIDLGEALLKVDFNWDQAFIGSKNGNVFLYKTLANRLMPKPLCRLGNSISELRAITEDGRRTLIVATTVNNSIQVRDAPTGLLLRLIEVPDNLSVNCILIDGNIIRCGTNERHLLSFELSSGQSVGQILIDSGIVCFKMYGTSLLLCGSSDGHIDAFHKITGERICRISEDRSKSLMDFYVVDEKIIISNREDRTLRSIAMPAEVISHTRK